MTSLRSGPGSWLRLAYAQHNVILFGVTLAVFVAIAALALTSYPVLYEDEPWTYLAPFEAIRGNGFSWGAFGEAHSVLGVFNALVTPFMAISPFGPEESIRASSVIAMLVLLTGAFALTQRLAPGHGWVAPALIVGTHVTFVAGRYGRVDVVAAALAMWALYCAVSGKPSRAGVLSALAVSVQPVNVWLGLPCMAFAWQQQDGPRRYVLGGMLGLVPQVAWVLYDLDGFRSVSGRYAISSSLGASASSGPLGSLLHEYQRFEAYVSSLALRDALLHFIAFVCLPLVAVVTSQGRRRIELLLLCVAPILALALLVQAKNPYYTFLLLEVLAVTAAIGVARLPGAIARTAALVLVAGVALNFGTFMDRAIDARGTPTSREAVPLIAEKLPHGALVFSWNLWAGLVDIRPDLHFFNYHSLSLRPGWVLPPCDQLDARILEVARNDRRRHPSPEGIEFREAYFVSVANPEVFKNYIGNIYDDTPREEADCLLPDRDQEQQLLKVCGSAGHQCLDLLITRRDLRAPPATPGGTPAVATCPCSFWPQSRLPDTVAVSDGNAYEAGMRFSSEAGGLVSGVRFYKGPGNGGEHVARLWSADGTLLASAPFRNETPEGWQETRFDQPVAISAGTTYLVSYSAPQGHIAADMGYFARRGLDALPLRAPKMAGAWAGAPGGFPGQSSGSNFWVDVIFETH